ncbi:MAG: YddF family protein [Elusimicrobiales bacterium]|nr:YddF family protein [Elusimicrobiales bacterium]
MKYILNSAVITSPGVYEYKIIDINEVKEWLKQGEVMNTIGYEETIKAFNELFGTNLVVNRKMVKMETGDEALVFRLTCRLDDVNLKGNLTKEFVLQNCEIGLLKKLK